MACLLLAVLADTWQAASCCIVEASSLSNALFAQLGTADFPCVQGQGFNCLNIDAGGVYFIGMGREWGESKA